ncbi:hypothetical protein M413DRAFT_29942 [Hebeloma cylindrosporum]|uniref:Uncharacterized protein n=1 Tax=Hebeloma cylindrosporum TaxID=76867 RepID=A0A0C3C547_HEBCY|nr:hypothetical protein M413DRAFT_29942 [Hebeloma cylindrosporum h7]
MSGTSPKPTKWSSRMGGVMRRASTVLAISRPGTPSERDSDSASLRRSTSREAAVAPPPPEPVSIPTPIAESPAREAEATQRDIIGPSPLAQQDTLPDIAPVESVVAAPVQPVSDEQTTIPTGYIPPPVVDSSVGNPGAFTDLLETLPQPDVVVDPYAATNANPAAVEAPVAEPKEETSAAAHFEAPAMEHTSSYFDKPLVESLKDFEPVDAPSGFSAAVIENTTIAPAPAPVDHEHEGEAASYYRGDPSMPIAEPHAHDEQPTAQDEHQPLQEHIYEHGEAASYYRGDPSMPIAEPHPVAASTTEENHHEEPVPVKHEPTHAAVPSFSTSVMPSYDLPSYMSQEPNWGAHPQNDYKTPDIWANVAPHQQEDEQHGNYHGVMPIPIPMTGSASGNGNASYHSKASSIRMPNPHPEALTDPFADPPTIAVTHVEGSYHAEVSEQHRQAAVETHDDANGTIIMPLPAFNEVVPSNSIHRVPSHSSLAASNGAHRLETDERIPLLARPGTPSKRPNTYLQTVHSPSPVNHSSVSPLIAGTSSWNAHGSASQHQPRLHDLGWVEYHLPDGSVYYVHPTRRITTDLNLRVDRILFAVDGWMEERKDETLDVGVEGWLREADAKKHVAKKASGGWWGGKKTTEEVIYFERFWVDHHARSVVKDEDEGRKAVGYARGHVHGYGGHGKGKKQAASAPQKSSEDHRLLPSQGSIPPPFTQEECQELMNLLRSFNREDAHDDHGIQTRVVSRILLRVALWRQTYFRPTKPLPKDVGSSANHLPIQRRPFRRTVFDFLVSCLCLGIPYLFLERGRLSSRMDEESGALPSASPMVIIGACTCLVAAIVLSASVTFLSLPGLDSVARTAGMVAVLFAAFSMAATGVAVLRHKADLERPVPHVGVEGLMVISRRTVALSLPVVFLAYALIGFITGITLYGLRGASLADPNLPKNSFEDYTRWTVVGVVGALAGIVTTSMLVLRR